MGHATRSLESEGEAILDLVSPLLQLSRANNEFGLRLLRERHEAGENLFLSPTSLGMALQMYAEANDEYTPRESGSQPFGQPLHPTWA